MSELTGWKFRLAEPRDSESFAKWVNGNPLIAAEDVEAAKKENNPTVVFFVVENPDGVAVGFAPVYAQGVISHLAFSPESTPAERKVALQLGLNGIMAFFAQYGIREIAMISKEDYPVAKWAVSQGFEAEPRQLFRLDMVKQAALAEG
jgi:hypothetical protein